jgi:iron complex outermembrane recepter protein
MSNWLPPQRVLGTARAFAMTLCLSIVILGTTGGRALAQDTGSPPPASSTPLEEVVVTGSRVARSTFTTPNPVTVLDSQDIQNLGLTNVGQVLGELPQNSNFFAANNVGLGNFNVGAQLANLRGLNPFFGTRTLTLVDTERVVPTATGGGVDVTLIPSMLVARTEVVTGGASAVYGSDAVAGVVNIILDKKLDGFKGTADYGQTQEHDGGDAHFSVGYGHDLIDGRAHFIVGAEYENSEDIGICDQVRDWCKSEETQYTNIGYSGSPPGAIPVVPPNGQPRYIVGPNGTLPNTSLTGVLVPCTIAPPGACISLGPSYLINATGTAGSVFNPGLYSDAGSPFAYSQGAGASGIGAYSGTTLRPAVKRYTALTDFDFKINDNLDSFLQASLARSYAVNPVANGSIGPIPLEVQPGVFIPLSSQIEPDNAFLPAQFKPGGANALPPGGALLGADVTDINPARNQTNNQTIRITGGLKGSFFSTWTWDMYFEWGQNTNNQALKNNVVSTFLQYSLDAVAENPALPVSATNPVVCRANDPTYYPTAYNSAAAGCVPLNLFGSGNASPAALAYAYRTLVEYSTLRQEVLSGNVGGDLFSGIGAGPIKGSFGAEVRRDSADVTHDLADQPFYDDYFLSYGLDYAGKISVAETYAEVNAPLLKDLPFAKNLEVDGAIRETYNDNEDETAGSTEDGDTVHHNIASWKLSSIWDLTDWFRIRGTRSRDVRAAGFRELYQTYAVTASGPFATITNPNPHAAITTEVIDAFTGGNINLEPEKADTTTFGIVLAPKSGPLEGFQFSADWYRIIINDPITGPPFGLGIQNIVDLCYQGQQAFCNRVTFGTPGDFSTITAVNNTAVNLGSFLTKGVDFETSYRLPMQNINSGLNGNLNFRLLTSLLYNMTVDAGQGVGPVDFAGQSGPTAAFGTFNTSPRWQSNFFTTYVNGPITGTVQLRYVGRGTYETVDTLNNLVVAPGSPGFTTPNAGSINDNSVASAVYVNLSGSYDINSNFSVFATINNLLNKSPPVAPGGNGYPTNPVYFDTYGMVWKIGFRAKF